MKAFAAVDLGGTRMKSAVVRGDGVPEVQVTDVDGREPLELLLDRLRELRHTAGCERAGLAVPGLVADGVLLALPGKLAGLESIDLGAAVLEATGMACVVSNDAIAYGIGEAVSGAARGARRAVVITVGTGIGCAVIENGHPLGGGALGGGLLGGQIAIAATSDAEDSNGQRGTIEALCNATRIGSTPESVQRWQGHLVTALVALAHAYAPDVMVCGGGPMQPHGGRPEVLLSGVEQRVNARLFKGYRVAVRPTHLGDSAALLGLRHLAERG